MELSARKQPFCAGVDRSLERKRLGGRVEGRRDGRDPGVEDPVSINAMHQGSKLDFLIAWYSLGYPRG